jgi:hypothetical protein
MQSIQTLRNIAFSYNSTESIEIENASALAQCMSKCFLDRIELYGLSFLTEETCQTICDGIEQSAASTFSFKAMSVNDGQRFGDALAYSVVESLEIACWPRANRAEMLRFLATLVLGLQIMDLETLDFAELVRWTSEDLPPFSMLPSLIGAASQCPTLRHLKLSSAPCLDEIDDALVDLTQSNVSQLKTICLGFPVRTTKARVSFPRILPSCMTNYTLLVYLKPGVHVDYDDEDPWCDSFRQNIDMLTRLNKSGRCYLTTDAASQAAGLRVLGDVGRDLNCLYFHLQENPILCQASWSGQSDGPVIC